MRRVPWYHWYDVRVRVVQGGVGQGVRKVDMKIFVNIAIDGLETVVVRYLVLVYCF